MPTEKKSKIIDSLEVIFAKSKVGVMTDYRGLKTFEVVALRRKLRENGIDFKVVKNTLARIAAKKAGKDKISSGLEGPMAIVFGYDDLSKPAKLVTEYIVAAKLNLTIKGGFMENQFLSVQDVKFLATLPSREVLLGKVMGSIQSPIYALANQLNAPLRGFMYVLQSRIKQLEGEQNGRTANIQS
jgi:large subunit ribosomal protein L10